MNIHRVVQDHVSHKELHDNHSVSKNKKQSIVHNESLRRITGKNISNRESFSGELHKIQDKICDFIKGCRSKASASQDVACKRVGKNELLEPDRPSTLKSSLKTLPAFLLASSVSVASLQGADFPEYGALHLGTSGPTNHELRLSSSVSNRLIDDSQLIHDAPTLKVGAAYRYYGIGVHGESDVVLERNASSKYLNTSGNYVQSNHVFGDARTVKFGGDLLLRTVAVDPFESIDFKPSINYETRKNEENGTKNEPLIMVGASDWAKLREVNFLELGGQAEFNVGKGTKFFRGNFGARQTFEEGSFTLTSWQTVNLASESYKETMLPKATAGFTTADIGAKISVPIMSSEAHVFAKGSWKPWIMSEDRALLQKNDINSSPFEFSVGVEFINR